MWSLRYNIQRKQTTSTSATQPKFNCENETIQESNRKDIQISVESRSQRQEAVFYLDQRNEQLVQFVEEYIIDQIQRYTHSKRPHANS